MPKSKGARKRTKESTTIHIPMDFEDAVRRILQAGPPPSDKPKRRDKAEQPETTDHKNPS